MATSRELFRSPSGIFSTKHTFHWTFNSKGRLTLHRDAKKCNRVHYNQNGVKEQ